MTNRWIHSPKNPFRRSSPVVLKVDLCFVFFVVSPFFGAGGGGEHHFSPERMFLGGIFLGQIVPKRMGNGLLPSGDWPRAPPTDSAWRRPIEVFVPFREIPRRRWARSGGTPAQSPSILVGNLSKPDFLDG